MRELDEIILNAPKFQVGDIITDGFFILKILESYIGEGYKRFYKVQEENYILIVFEISEEYLESHYHKFKYSIGDKITDKFGIFFVKGYSSRKDGVKYILKSDKTESSWSESIVNSNFKLETNFCKDDVITNGKEIYKVISVDYPLYILSNFHYITREPIEVINRDFHILEDSKLKEEGWMDKACSVILDMWSFSEFSEKLVNEFKEKMGKL